MFTDVSVNCNWRIQTANSETLLNILRSKIRAFWVLTPCTSERDRRFGGIYHLYSSRPKSKASTKQTEADDKPSSDSNRYLLGLLFEPEHGGDVFLRIA
jgi:hypothetical protein